MSNMEVMDFLGRYRLIASFEADSREGSQAL